MSAPEDKKPEETKPEEKKTEEAKPEEHVHGENCHHEEEAKVSGKSEKKVRKALSLCPKSINVKFFLQYVLHFCKKRDIIG